ncbi:MAG: Abi family protein [Bacilli bacterium]|nr:Abi family protein [Bacilli bacterium]
MLDKKFKTLDEQIEIFRSKNLTINNEEYAKRVLLRENYFFLNGYRHLFLNKDRTYKEGTTLEELYSLFLFDRTFRNICFKNILIIENNFKSISSYQLSKKYGYRERDYLRSKNFTSNPSKQRQINDLLKKMKRQIRINSNQHAATQHYADNYGYIPLWILVKVLSFGIVSEMYSILKEDDRQAISSIYDIDPDTFETYLPILANYRNLCAHEDILYENRTQKQIPDTVYHQLLKIPRQDGEYIYGKNDAFSLLIIMKQLLEKEKFNSLVIEVENAVQTLAYNLKTIPITDVLRKMGFPLNWKELKNIERSKDNNE